MSYAKRREQLLKALAEQRDIQRQAELMLDNARAAEHQLLGGIAMLDEILREQGSAEPQPPTEPAEEMPETGDLKCVESY